MSRSCEALKIELNLLSYDVGSSLQCSCSLPFMLHLHLKQPTADTDLFILPSHSDTLIRIPRQLTAPLPGQDRHKENMFQCR